MGFLGLGSVITMLQMKYGSPESVRFTERVAKELAITGWETGVELAKEKGPAPIFKETFTVTEELSAKDPFTDGRIEIGKEVPCQALFMRSQYFSQIVSAIPRGRMKQFVADFVDYGCRFTHHSSIAPTGTISLSLANNASNGIEPSFSHKYLRNVIRDGKKTKEQIAVYSYELLAYRTLVNPKADPESEDPECTLPDYFITADSINPKSHVDIQAAAQKWVDSSISKTINVPADIAYDDFKDIYLYAWKSGLKGCTTFRFNPDAFSGVLVREEDLAKTRYRFRLADGEVVEVSGNEQVEYDGEIHTASNLFDALKEGYYGRF